MGDLLAEELLNPLRSGQRVFNDVVQQPGGDRNDVQFHVGQRVGDLEWMDEVRLTRVAHLTLVFEGREHIGAPKKLQVRLRAVAPHLLEEGLESNHEERCLSCTKNGV